MGYRSDVRIITSKKGYKQLLENVEKNVEYLQAPINLLTDKNYGPQVFTSNDQVMLNLDYLKWYDEYKDVQAVMKGLEQLEQQGYSYRYARLGEEIGDIEELYADGEIDSDIELAYPCVSQQFDDLYITTEYGLEKLASKQNDEIEI